MELSEKQRKLVEEVKNKELQKLNVLELRKLVKQLGIGKTSQLRKVELIKAIETHLAQVEKADKAKEDEVRAEAIHIEMEAAAKAEGRSEEEQEADKLILNESKYEVTDDVHEVFEDGDTLDRANEIAYKNQLSNSTYLAEDEELEIEVIIEVEDEVAVTANENKKAQVVLQSVVDENTVDMQKDKLDTTEDLPKVDDVQVDNTLEVDEAEEDAEVTELKVEVDAEVQASQDEGQTSQESGQESPDDLQTLDELDGEDSKEQASIDYHDEDLCLSALDGILDIPVLTQEEMIPLVTDNDMEAIHEIIALHGSDMKKAAVQIAQYIVKKGILTEFDNELKLLEDAIKKEVYGVYQNERYLNKVKVELFDGAYVDTSIVQEKLEQLEFKNVLDDIYKNVHQVNLLQTKHIGVLGIENEDLIYYICMLMKEHLKNIDVISHIILNEIRDENNVKAA